MNIKTEEIWTVRHRLAWVQQRAWGALNSKHTAQCWTHLEMSMWKRTASAAPANPNPARPGGYGQRSLSSSSMSWKPASTPATTSQCTSASASPPPCTCPKRSSRFGSRTAAPSGRRKTRERRKTGLQMSFTKPAQPTTTLVSPPTPQFYTTPPPYHTQQRPAWGTHHRLWSQHFIHSHSYWHLCFIILCFKYNDKICMCVRYRVVPYASQAS